MDVAVVQEDRVHQHEQLDQCAGVVSECFVERAVRLLCRRHQRTVRVDDRRNEVTYGGRGRHEQRRDAQFTDMRQQRVACRIERIECVTNAPRLASDCVCKCGEELVDALTVPVPNNFG